MIRALALSLILLNAAFFLWHARPAPSGVPEADNALTGLPSLRLLDELSPVEFAAMQRTDGPKLAMNCWLIGPFPLRAQYEELRLAFGRLGVRMRPQAVTLAADTAHWVIAGPYASREAAEQARYGFAQHIGLEPELITQPEGRFELSFGLFSSRERAEQFLESRAWPAQRPDIRATSRAERQLWGRFTVRGVADLETAVLATVVTREALGLRKKSCNTIASTFQFD